MAYIQSGDHAVGKAAARRSLSTGMLFTSNNQL